MTPTLVSDLTENQGIARAPLELCVGLYQAYAAKTNKAMNATVIMRMGWSSDAPMRGASLGRSEPYRVCRRPQLLRGWGYDKQVERQVWPGATIAGHAAGLDHTKEHPYAVAGRCLPIAAKMGCTAQTLNEWVEKEQGRHRQARRHSAVTAERLKALERENRKLRQANGMVTVGQSVSLFPGGLGGRITKP